MSSISFNIRHFENVGHLILGLMSFSIDLHPFSCIPDYVENLISGTGGFGDLTTYELLCSSDSPIKGVTPIKYTGIKKDSTGRKELMA